ncbi:MAG: hypothetical protein ACE5I7_02440 [Candidatus Binatia bacterium]
MKRFRIAWLILLAAALGCAGADGGPVGTGISASISGNVIDVQAASTTDTAGGAAMLPPVQVSIDEQPGVGTTTDDNGNFELSGDFAGALTLRFAVPDFQVTQPLDVPAGSAIVLQDIELRPSGVEAQAVRQLGLRGRVDLVDCTDGTLLVHDRRDPDTQFLIRLLPDTSLTRGRGESVTCADIRRGDNVVIEGAIRFRTDRTIAALTVALAPPPPPSGRRPIRDVPFVGDVAAINCDAGFIVIDDSSQRSRLRLSRTTLVTRPDGTPLRCGDLGLGDRVEGRGQIMLRMPGVIEATRIIARPSPAPGALLRFFGFVAAIDCGSGVLQLDDVTNTVRLRLLPATVIVRSNQQPAACADIRLGDRVTGAGHVSGDGSGSIEAVRVILTRRGPAAGRR